MSINDYLEKLRAKPVREREKIAIVATGISFFVVLVIWLMSFSEMSKNENQEPGSSPVTNQLEDLKKNIGEDKQSIQDMMQNLPQNNDLNSVSNESLPSAESGSQDQNGNNIKNDQSEIPQLP